jgi:hypothetical protein
MKSGPSFVSWHMPGPCCRGPVLCSLAAAGPVAAPGMAGPRSAWFVVGAELFVLDDMFSTPDAHAPEPTEEDLAGGGEYGFDHDRWLELHSLLLWPAGTTLKVLATNSDGASVQWVEKPTTPPFRSESDDDMGPQHEALKCCFVDWTTWNPAKVRVVDQADASVGGAAGSCDVRSSVPAFDVSSTPERMSAAAALMEFRAAVSEGVSHADVAEDKGKEKELAEIGGGPAVQKSLTFPKSRMARPKIPVAVTRPGQPISEPRLAYIFTLLPAGQLMRPPPVGTLWWWHPDIDQDDWMNDFPTSRKWVKSGSLRADARGRALRGKREEEILWGGTRERRRL